MGEYKVLTISQSSDNLYKMCPNTHLKPFYNKNLKFNCKKLQNVLFCNVNKGDPRVEDYCKMFNKNIIDSTIRNIYNEYHNGYYDSKLVMEEIDKVKSQINKIQNENLKV